MIDSPTTLRTLWVSARDALAEYGREAEAAITTKSAVDWPIWLVILLAPVGIFALAKLLPWVVDLLSLFRALVQAIKDCVYDVKGKLPGGHMRFPDKRLTSAQLQMLQAQRGLYPPDPAERSRWANREGEFADD